MAVPTARTRRAGTAPADAARGSGAGAGPEPGAGAEPGAKRRARSGAVTPVLRVRRAIAHAVNREQIVKNRTILEELEAGNTAGGDVFPETQSEIEHLKAQIA